MLSKSKKLIVTIILLTSVVTIISIFWHHQLKYALPTPLPAQYVAVSEGETVVIPSFLPKKTAYFFHFYNSDCPCSRFNARHIKSLIAQYNKRVRFVIVVNDQSSLKKAKDAFGSDIEYVHDAGLAIAKACGVYATPQAAIVTEDGKLFYRGNYNASRYCTTRASNFAELSLIALLNGRPAPDLGIAATQSYGCELQTSEIQFF